MDNRSTLEEKEMTKDYIKDIPNWEEQYLATEIGESAALGTTQWRRILPSSLVRGSGK